MVMSLGACDSVGSGSGRWKWARRKESMAVAVGEEPALPTESEAELF
jgi:hypothetical protein